MMFRFVNVLLYVHYLVS